MKYDSSRIKIILVGPSASGKSTFLEQIKYERLYSQKYLPTIGVNLGVKTVEFNNKNIIIHFWDTAGQERFDSIVSLYYRDVDFVLFLFDLNDCNEEIIKKWILKINKNTINKPIIIIGNKKDISTRSFLNESKNINFEIEDNENILKYFEISTHDINNVNYVLDYIFNQVINKFENLSKKDETVNSKKFNKSKGTISLTSIYNSIKKFFKC